MLGFSLSGASRPVKEVRSYLYGYRYGEVELDKLDEIKEKSKISKVRQEPSTRRVPVAVGLGCEAKDFSLPHPDPCDPDTLVAGVRKRFLRKTPEPKHPVIRELRAYVRNKVRKYFKPLDPNSDVSVETWLNKTHYPTWRKRQLLKEWEKVKKCQNVAVQCVLRDKLLRKLFSCKSFMKMEHYIQNKHARAINSRSDGFKCLVGPIFKLIEEEVFKHPAFIKHVPVADRPDYIMNMMQHEGAKYIATDYTAFESLFTREIMEAVEFELYEWMCSALPDGPYFMKLCREILAGTSVCAFRYFTVTCPATRMSGEMCTSLGNGFSNLMFMKFMCKRKGCKHVKGVVEGDDGLFTMQGEPPSTEDFAELGLRIKLEKHDSISTASFCGILFDEVERINVTNPVKTLASFGWTGARYLRSPRSTLDKLLRAKSLSLMHQYPGCPILQSLARYGMRMTSSIKYSRLLQFITRAEGFDSWTREKLLDALHSEVPERDPGERTRFLVEKLFCVSVDRQIEIEKYLDSLDKLEPLVVDLIVHKDWTEFHAKYMYRMRYDDDMMDQPPHNWQPLAGFSKEW
jgi:hypothetical protein